MNDRKKELRAENGKPLYMIENSYVSSYKTPTQDKFSLNKSMIDEAMKGVDISITPEEDQILI